MNIFMPDKQPYLSIIALDDRRLNKQILECKTILRVALENKKGYALHPVVRYYKDYPKFVFVIIYGAWACDEYFYRFNKRHSLDFYFSMLWSRYADERNNIVLPMFGMFYCEGKATDPNCIRTTENTVELFRQKLCKKWDNDKIPPKWTNREPPVWYKRKEN